MARKATKEGERRKELDTRALGVATSPLTQLIYEPPEVCANDTPKIAAGLFPPAAVRIKVDVAKRVVKAKAAAVGVNDVDEGSIGPRKVTLLSGVHVQRISRVQSGDSAYLKPRFPA